MNQMNLSKAIATTSHGTEISRRKFLSKTATVAATLSVMPRHVLGGPGKVSPNSKTTLACIGVGGQGTQNMMTFAEFPEVQIVAVCDVNKESGGYVSWNWSKGTARQTCGREPARRAVDEYYGKQQPSGQYRGCKAYTDYRELLEKEDVDAVMIATPDHMHAVIAMAAIKRHKHVYCEKPLAWSVHECRQVTEAARKAGVATQLGNQGQAEESARVIQEFILDGAIGPVREAQVWTGPRFWKFTPWEERPKAMPVPEGLDWDLWLGPAPERPYNAEYCPWTWRNWWDFGTGLIGDLGCHKLSTVFKALKFGHPISIEASAAKLNPETHALGVIARLEFPARGDMPPAALTWYDGGLKPFRPPELEPNQSLNDTLFTGDKGMLMGHRLIPESKQKAYGKPPVKLPRSPGHHKEWVIACRGGEPAGSNFVDHSGLLSEACMLINVAVRAQKKILWDGPNFKITNDKEANNLLHREYRKGWSL